MGGVVVDEVLLSLTTATTTGGSELAATSVAAVSSPAKRMFRTKQHHECMTMTMTMMIVWLVVQGAIENAPGEGSYVRHTRPLGTDRQTDKTSDRATTTDPRAYRTTFCRAPTTQESSYSSGTSRQFLLAPVFVV